jgi:chaperonin GroES
MPPIDAMCSIVSPTENRRAASNHHTATVARWDDDGGAQEIPARMPKPSRRAVPSWSAISPTAHQERSMKFRPLHDRVVVKRVEAESKTASGIIIPDNAKEKPSEGEVVAVGPGGRDEAGKLIPVDVATGDRVLFGKWSGTEVKLDGVEYLIMKESDIMGVLVDVQARKKAA